MSRTDLVPKPGRTYQAIATPRYPRLDRAVKWCGWLINGLAATLALLVIWLIFWLLSALF